jgi:hypothetical protein
VARKIVSPFNSIFRRTIPYQTSPVLAFIVIMLYIFLIVKYR